MLARLCRFVKRSRSRFADIRQLRYLHRSLCHRWLFPSTEFDTAAAAVVMYVYEGKQLCFQRCTSEGRLVFRAVAVTQLLFTQNFPACEEVHTLTLILKIPQFLIIPKKFNPSPQISWKYALKFHIIFQKKHTDLEHCNLQSNAP